MIAGLPQEVIDRLDVLGLEPLNRFDFAVHIDGQLSWQRFVAGCNSVDGLEARIETRDVPEGGYRGVHSFPRRATFSDITMSRGLTFSRYLWDWYQSVLFWTKGREDYRRNVSIYQLSKIFQVGQEIPFEVWRFDILQAYPTAWIGPKYDSMANEMAFESVVLKHAGITAAQGIFSGAGGEALSMLT